MMRASISAPLCLAILIASSAAAQPGGNAPAGIASPANSEAATEGHLVAIETAAQRSLDTLVAEFEDRRFAPGYRAATTPAERRALLTRIRDAAAQAGGVDIGESDGVFVVTLEGPATFEVRLGVADHAPFGITSLAIAEIAPPAPLNRATLEADIDALMAEGDRSGVVYVAIDGEPIVQKAYGMAHPALGIANRLDTVFGVGSRPIDFTVAAIYLLEQRGQLGLDDTLGDHLPDAPADRASMTLRQMMTGQSGLPDFPAAATDWDADLGWIDRTEFERRTMAVPLLFAPGEGEAHSHWAFGVLAAIVERVSGQGYYEFLRENFFDPAGMERTGNYGESRGLALADFAVGGGNRIGLPNIPPNWGPTSWLVMGSGGMFSTLGDLQRFYAYVTSGDVLEPRYVAHFLGTSAQLDGSDRGFELFSFADEERSDQAYVFLNSGGGPGAIRPLMRPLMTLLREN